MAERGDRAGAVLMPYPIGHTLRALARWAVAAFLGVPAVGLPRPELAQAVLEQLG